MDPVAAGVPVAAAPHAMPTASSSLSAFMHTPPTAGQLGGHVLEHLGERRHRVAGEEAAAGGDHRVGDRLRALQEQAGRGCGLGHAFTLSGTVSSRGVSYLYTWKQKSGQIHAHAWHPVQPAFKRG